MSLGLTITGSNPQCVSIERETRESIINVTIEDAPRRDFRLSTGIDFFNHMLEQIAWRSCLNIDASYENTQFRLMHVITEDTGIVLGTAFAELLSQRMLEGVEGAGSASLGIDEALALSSVSFEGRSTCILDIAEAPGLSVPQVEDALSADMLEFFRGFAQGGRCSIFIKALSGEDPHHSFEAVYRSFGLALKESLKPNPWRAGMTAGVKGVLD